MGTPSSPTRDPRPSLGPWLTTACILGLVACSYLLAAMILDHPDLLHVRRPSAPQTLLALAGAGALLALVLRHPGVGLVLLLAFVYLNLSEVLVRYHRMPSLLQLLVPPLALAAWGDRYGTHRGAPRHGPLTAALVGYLAVVLFSTVLARDSSLADDRLIEAGKAFVLFLLVLWLASSLDRIRVGAWTLLACAGGLSSLGLWQVLTGDVSQDFGGLARVKEAHIYGSIFEGRLSGPLGDPNFFAQALLMVVPVGLALAWWEPRPRRRVAAWIVSALVLLGIVFTYSRGAALALVVVLGLCLLDRKVRWRHVAVGAALFLLVLLLLPGEFTARLTTLRQLVPGGSEEVLRPDSSFQKRRLYALSAWRMFLDHPAVGVGVGNYATHYDGYAEEVGSSARLYGMEGEPRYPHNLYLEIAAETGFLGLTAFALVLAVAFASIRRARRRLLEADEVPSAALARAFEIGLVGYLVSSLFLHGHYQRYLWLLFAFIAAFWALTQELSAREGAPEGVEA